MMRRSWFVRGWIVVLLISLLTPQFYATASIQDLQQDATEQVEQWIIRWKDGAPPAEFLAQSEVHHFDDVLGVTVASPNTLQDQDAWIEAWSQSDDILYMEPNRKVSISASTNDPLLRFQSHLKQIQAESAWDSIQSNTSITIGVVDTGVDFNHPDLKLNLLDGKNIINENATAQDDHGHGTNVAGVLAAIGNNQTGVSGVMWNAKILPIKALDASGTGSEDQLGRGIKYAVDNGAKIVVLSLGLYKYSNYLQDIANYAEQKGVLLVAASGNDGQIVKYPAAYPTVFAVGGINENYNVESKSNFGPELDIVAPWKVFTTALGGGYDYNQGTSMATPQVAAVAALVWAKYPEMTPEQLRNHLRMTAQDIGASGWDELSGYGMLRADQALSAKPVTDIHEPNNTKESAANIPINAKFSGELSTKDDLDWYRIFYPYDGQLTLKFSADQLSDLEQLEINYVVGGKSVQVFTDVSKPITVDAYKGMGYLLVKGSSNWRSALQYSVTSQFTIYRDAFEDNDRQYKAFHLPSSVTRLTGTFHQLNDQDWYLYTVTKEGSLQIKASGDTYRMDLAIWLQREDGTPYFVDIGGDGEPEISKTIDVLPGKYYIRITNESLNMESHPVAGEYTLFVEYNEKLIDPNEPNDKLYESSTLVLDRTMQGHIDVREDEDWYSFKITKESVAKLQLSNIPTNRIMTIRLYDAKQTLLKSISNEYGKNSVKLEEKLTSGTYYAQLTSYQSFSNTFYQFKVSAVPLVAGFTDISNHWALESIQALTEKQLIKGYDNYTFQPNRLITRAEVAQMMVRVMGLTKVNEKFQFEDINQSHWAYDALNKATAAGLMTGYPDNTIKPDLSITRAEMAVILARALQLGGVSQENSPFSDVEPDYWAYPYLVELQQKGWLKGYEDGSFKPARGATRAEFVTLMHQFIDRK